MSEVRSASDGVAGGSQVQVLRRRADCVAADRATNQLDDEVDDRARHRLPPCGRKRAWRAAASYCPRVALPPRSCSVSVTSQSMFRGFSNTIARFQQSRIPLGCKLSPQYAQVKLRILTGT
jgi:hypothetical protein